MPQMREERYPRLF